MPATNASQRLGFGILGALLAGGLLLAACAAPDGRTRADDASRAPSKAARGPGPANGRLPEPPAPTP
ncbi:hypothetical protein [Streptomyces sp. NBC_01233]|uniref:hypothetical protein n=1 Tax=Streptomyces sp. NBC_01233 TaxID=2903787 RepID=UPI002E0FD5F8|nr:hypothetical protein OG332_36145 [Streptomyces sp. NBC_01233]